MASFTESISDATICNWFYWFAWINGILAVFLAVLFGYVIFNFPSGKNPIAQSVFTGKAIGTLVGVVIATTNYLFFNLMCERALKPARGRSGQSE